MQRCRVADLQLATDTDGELKGQAVPRRSLGRPGPPLHRFRWSGRPWWHGVPPFLSHGYRGKAAHESERSQMALDLVMARHWTLMAS